MMVGRFSSVGHGRDESDPSQEIPELVSFRDDVATSAPAREISQLTLDRNVR
jgi:hypothetical protein